MQKIYQTNGNQKKAMHMSDKIDFKLKWSKASHYTVIIYIHRGEKTIPNLYAPNIRASIYVKQIVTGLKGEINISNNSG